MHSDIRKPENCPHRESVRTSPDGESATCSLLRSITGLTSHPGLRVARDACEACCESYPPSTTDLNPILASLLFAASEQVIEEGGAAGLTVDKAHELNRWAERSLPAVAPDEDDCVDIGRKSYAHLSTVTTDIIAQHLPRPDEKATSEVKRWMVGVTTSPRRMPTLQQCVESITASGWSDPVLFIDGDVDVPASIANLNCCRRIPALGAFPNYMLSLSELYMRDPHADAYMMIQDDALLLGTPSLREYLESVLWPSNGSCIASLYCSTRYNQESAGWHRFPGNWIWGAVAFVFSQDALLALLTSMHVYDHRASPDDAGLSKIDVMIGQFAAENEIPIYYPSPSLVQHIGTISTIWSVARAVNARRADQFIGDIIESP